MNTSEQTAYQWLQEEQGYEESEITRQNQKQTPDFICPDKAFEVKRPRGNTLVVHENQVSQIESYETVVVVADSSKVRDQFPWTERESVDWNVNIQERNDGKAIWLSGETLEWINSEKYEHETVNQFLKRYRQEAGNGLAEVEQLENILRAVKEETITKDDIDEVIKQYT